MNDPYNDLKDNITTGLMAKLKEKAQGGKLVIDFRDKLSPQVQAQFITSKATILIANKEIQLPLHKNGHFLCEVMFGKNVGEPIDWSVIYEQMTGYYRDIFGEPMANRKNWHSVYDAVKAVNKIFQEQFDGDLFEWKNKTVKRLH